MAHGGWCTGECCAMQAGATTLVALGRRHVGYFAGRRNGRAWLGCKVHVDVLAVCMCPDARAYVLMHTADVCVCCVHGSCRPRNRSRCRPACAQLLRLRRKVLGVGRTSLIAWKSAHAHAFCCAQAMRHCADCGRSQQGCGRLPTKQGQI